MIVDADRRRGRRLDGAPTAGEPATVVDLYPFGRALVLDIVVRSLFGERLAARAARDRRPVPGTPGLPGGARDRDSSRIRSLHGPGPGARRPSAHRRHHRRRDRAPARRTRPAIHSTSSKHSWPTGRSPTPRSATRSSRSSAPDSTRRRRRWRGCCGARRSRRACGSSSGPRPTRCSARSGSTRRHSDDTHARPARGRGPRRCARDAAPPGRRRLSPREAAADLTVGGYRIPKGTLILWSAHLAGTRSRRVARPVVVRPGPLRRSRRRTQGARRHRVGTVRPWGPQLHRLRTGADGVDADHCPARPTSRRAGRRRPPSRNRWAWS